MPLTGYLGAKQARSPEQEPGQAPADLPGKTLSGGLAIQAPKIRQTALPSLLSVTPPFSFPCQCRRHPHHSPYPLNTHKYVQGHMEGAGKSEKSENESPPLRIDPKWYVRSGLPRFSR